MLNLTRHQLRRAPQRRASARGPEEELRADGPVTQTRDVLDLRAAAAWFGAQSAQRVRALVDAGEQAAHRIAPTATSQRVLARAKVGDAVRVPCALVRPGQVQLSFDRVREHVEKFLRRLHGTSPDAVRTLAEELGLLAVPGIVRPQGRGVVLPDRNHNFAALLALLGWLDVHGRAPNASHAVRALRRVLFAEPEGPTVLVRVEETHATHDARASLAALRATLFLVRRDGALARTLPRRFAALEDNPVRALVSRARVKVKRAKGTARGVHVSTRDLCVWVKGPGAPHYVEFHIAAIVARALEAAGRPYHGVRAIDREDEEIMRRALHSAARDPLHPSAAALSRVLVLPPALRTRAALTEALRLRADGTPKLA